MSYIKFEKGQVVNLEFSLSREVIRTNRAGSYSSTTLWDAIQGNIMVYWYVPLTISGARDMCFFLPSMLQF